MVRSILEIGNAKYKIDRNSLRRFLQEAQGSVLEEKYPDPARETVSEESLDRVFNEVMRLYNEYAVSGKLELLIRLKCELEQVSLRYKSVALAEEVLSINSCLPYEWRVRDCRTR